MTGRSQTLLWWPGEKGVKTTENKMHWPRCMSNKFSISTASFLFKTYFTFFRYCFEGATIVRHDHIVSKMGFYLVIITQFSFCFG
jgi:hypothetical protein